MNRLKIFMIGVGFAGLFSASGPTYALFERAKEAVKTSASSIKNSASSIKNSLTNNKANQSNQPELGQAKENLKKADTLPKSAVSLSPNSGADKQIMKK